MAKAVWKFDISKDDLNEISLPFGAQPLSVQERDEVVRLWCLCDPDMTVYETRRFRLARTGQPIHENNLVFIDTAQVRDGEVVYHLFEVRA